VPSCRFRIFTPLLLISPRDQQASIRCRADQECTVMDAAFSLAVALDLASTGTAEMNVCKSTTFPLERRKFAGTGITGRNARRDAPGAGILPTHGFMFQFIAKDVWIRSYIGPPPHTSAFTLSVFQKLSMRLSLCVWGACCNFFSDVPSQSNRLACFVFPKI